MKNRVLFITLSKSGSQWVRDVLSAPEVAEHSGFKNAHTSLVLQNLGQFDLPEGMFCGPLYGMTRIEWQSCKRPGDKALVVVRDPRDRLVSFMFSVRYSHYSMPSVDYCRLLLADKDNDQECLSSLLRDVGYSVRFYLLWLTGMPDDDAYLVRYEDLLLDQYGQFQAMAEWLGWQVPDKILSLVVARLSFEARSGGRRRGQLDLASHYRMGMAGDWRNYFTRELGCLWESLYPGFLVQIGYEQHNDWWQALPTQTEFRSEQPTADIEVLRSRVKQMEEELREKEQQIRLLSAACDERLALINWQAEELKQLNEVYHGLLENV